MDLQLLAEFAALARRLNFSRAAQELHLTQPTLSRHIARLEAELDVPLLRRDRQSVSLTEAGTLFLPEAAAVLARYDAALERVREYRDGTAGNLALGYRWVCGGGPWPRVLPAFRAQYPRIAVRLLSYADTDPLQDAVREGVLDAAVTVRTKGDPPSDFQEVTLHALPLMAVMRCDHPLAARGAVTPAELSGVRLLGPRTHGSTGFPALMTDLFRACSRPAAVSWSEEGLEEAILRVQMDDMVALVPQCYYPDAGASGLRAVQVAGTTGLFRLAALASAGSSNPAVPLFLRTCRSACAEARRAGRMGDVVG